MAPTRLDKKHLAEQYFDAAHEAGYSSARNLLRVNSRGERLSLAEKRRIADWLSNVDAYTLHHPVRKRIPRLYYDVDNVDDVWEGDLCQFDSIYKENDGYRYVLVVIDVLSKFAFVEALRQKTADAVAAGFERILARSDNRKPALFQSDRGREFLGAAFQRVLKKHDIRFRTARNPDIKCAVVERFNRTLKSRLSRLFTHRNTHRFVDVLQSVVDGYNDSFHSSIKKKPSQVTIYNAAEAHENMIKRAISNRKRVAKTAKYHVDDYVRISRTKSAFAKGYERNFTEEIFKVTRVVQRQGIYIYEVCDLNDEPIDGFFYTEELVRVSSERFSKDRTFKIDTVLDSKGRGKNKKLLIRWKGWGPSFDSWEKASDVMDI